MDIEELVLSAKNNEKDETRLRLPIFIPNGEFVGMMYCVDKGMMSDELIRDMTKWRQENMQWFLTQFIATEPRTKSWMENDFLPDPTRILFIMKDAYGNLIGQYGLRNMSSELGEIDIIIRGNKGGVKGFIHYSEIAILAWMFGKNGQSKSNLFVFSHNDPTVKLHTSTSFEIVDSLKLSEDVIPPDYTHYYLVESDNGKVADFTYLEMATTKKRFLSTHPWVMDYYPGRWTWK
jgi:RimJ/RimL family protein N-acetyltransferase